MARKREERGPDLDGGALTHNPFRAALGGREPEAEPEPARAPEEGGEPLSGRLVARRETKGRRGKGVVRVTGLGGDEASRADLARELKRALGLGAQLEGAELVVQGEDVERVARWLEGRGATRVVRGN